MAPEYETTLTDAPDRADVEAIGRGLDAFNDRHAGTDGHRSLALLLRDADGTLVGGLVGSTYYGWLHVGLLWVEEQLRGQGHGERLLEAAEQEAVRRGCSHAFLNTFEFQAPAFYRRRGYEVAGRLPSFPAGFTRFLLAKRLDAEPTSVADDVPMERDRG